MRGKNYKVNLAFSDYDGHSQTSNVIPGSYKINLGFEEDYVPPTETKDVNNHVKMYSFDHNSKDPPLTNGTSNGSVHKSKDKNGFTIPEKKKEKQKDSQIKKTSKKIEHPPVSIFTLFTFTSVVDKVLLFFGILTGTLAGAAMPTIMILLGSYLDAFVNHDMNKNDALNATNITDEEFLSKTTSLTYGMLVTGCWLLLFNFISVACFSMAAANQAHHIRCQFMKSILSQDASWFDTNQTGDFANQMTNDLKRIEDGIGQKLGIGLFYFSSTVLCLVCALVYGWKLTLVILSIMPVLIVATGLMAKVQATLAADELVSYGKAGSIAEEILSSIRTVVAFGGEKKEIDRYEKNLVYAKKSGVKRGLATSVGLSIMWFINYASYALAFWYGVTLILNSRESGDDEYKAGTLLIIFFNVLLGALNMGMASPYIEALNISRGSAAKIYSIIKRVPNIDSSSSSGKIPASINGGITFKDVYFRYPSRPDVPILQSLSIDVNPGEIVALVGPSGCGKSTVIQLIQRFYDPLEGQVLLDGEEIKNLNVGWLRNNIGVVGQEPVLFATTIYENIRYGRLSATRQEIEKAAEEANAHSFIMDLPNQYDTLIGQKGAQLSGGQKQRIAIARALVRNPKILLLDEATSALDTESEALVQTALDKASKGRTTFIVAHRLSTVQNAHKILVISNGRLQQQGSHEELMDKKGLYYKLVQVQQSNGDKTDDEDDDEVEENIFQGKNSLTRLPSPLSVTIGNGSDEESTEKVDEETSLLFRIFKMIIPEWPYILTGSVACIVMGLTFPVYGLLFGEVLAALALSTREQVESRTVFLSLMFLLLGFVSAFAVFIQTMMFTIAGEKLTMRLRKFSFASMLRQDIGWFDDSKNNTGVLCSRLSTDASSVQGATGARIAIILQALSTLVAAIVIALYFSWKLGLVVLSFVPVILISMFLETKLVAVQVDTEKRASEQAVSIGVETIGSIRTVASLHREKHFYEKYVGVLDKPFRSMRKKNSIRGLTFGFVQSVPCISYGVAMYYGSRLVSSGELNFGDLFKVAEAVIMGTFMFAQAVAYAPDYSSAKNAALRVFKLLDLKTSVDSFSEDGLKPKLNGEVNFSNVYFKYPTRPTSKVLRGLNLTVPKGKTCALVGRSGCGKSTSIQLLERFYNVLAGNLMVDGNKIEDINVSYLRSQIGLVSQEPVLFSCSIKDNIAYGDNSREVPMEEIIEAARKANIHNFISSLPTGYDTNVGGKGSQLSGGQKQRIAIARALVRNPKILLLDEATSALDTESEKIVQEALDKAREGRTCIIIAHRLSTIQNADTIVVMHNGREIEQGTHESLLELRSSYYRLSKAQKGAS